MFKGLLNRVKVDLVRRYLECDIWTPINRQPKANGGDQPSFCASLIQNPRGSLNEIEMSFLAGHL